MVSLAQQFETNTNGNQLNHWIFGDSVYLYFGMDSLNTKTINFNSREASATISIGDSLILYGSPTTLWSIRNQKKITGLPGHTSSTQGSLFLNTDSCILFFVSNENNFRFNNKLISFELNTWDSIVNSKMLLDSCTEQLSSVNHQNNKDVWLFTHKSINDEFNGFLVQEKLLCCPIRTKIGGNYSKGFYTPAFNGYQIKFSPSGKLICAIRSESDQAANARMDLFKFDGESGEIKDNIYLNMINPVRVSFSPDESRIYVSNNRITQLTLSNWNHVDINNSQTLVLNVQNYWIGDMQISKKGTILYAVSDSSFLGEIKYPNNFGDSCKLNKKAVSLNYGKCNYGLPNFNASYFYTPSIDFAYTEDCWNHAYNFEGRDTFDADGYQWVFQKGSYRDSVLTKHCNYQFPDTGMWLVSHIAWNTSRSDTVTKTLTLRSKWQQDLLGRDTFYCSGDTMFQLTLKAPPNMHCIHWNGEEPNLDEDLGPIVDYNHFHVDSLLVDTAGTYLVKLTNKTFCQLYDTLVVEEKPKPAKPLISYNTGELASTVVADRYNWYLNDTFFLTTSERSIIPSKSGTYQLVLTSEFGCKSDKSDSFFLSLGISEKSEKDQSFLIYPNPGDGLFNIKTNLNQYELEIYDATGRKVKEDRNCSSFRLNVPGNYVVVIKTEGERFSRVISVK